MNTVASAFKAAANQHPMVCEYNEIVRSKGWTWARKWVKEQRQAAARLYQDGDATMWNQGYMIGMWP